MSADLGRPFFFGVLCGSLFLVLRLSRRDSSYSDKVSDDRTSSTDGGSESWSSPAFAATYLAPLLMSVSGAELDAFTFVEFDVVFDKSQRISSVSLMFLV